MIGVASPVSAGVLVAITKPCNSNYTHVTMPSTEDGLRCVLVYDLLVNLEVMGYDHALRMLAETITEMDGIY